MAQTLYYPATLPDTNVNPAWVEFQFYERKSPKSSPPDDCVQLYMPEGAANPSTVNWNTEAFGFMGNTVANGMDQNGGFWGSAGDAANIAWERGKAGVQAGIANRRGGRVSAEGILSNSGKVPNPYLTMLFKGVDFRTYSFTFKFFPFSEKDSETIHNISKTLRKNSLPDYASESSEAFLGYPKEVEVAYKWRGESNKYLHKFKRSVITALDVDYTPNGMFAVMRNGMPACIQVSMKLSEIELVMRKDVDEGY